MIGRFLFEVNCTEEGLMQIHAYTLKFTLFIDIQASCFPRAFNTASHLFLHLHISTVTLLHYLYQSKLSTVWLNFFVRAHLNMTVFITFSTRSTTYSCRNHLKV